MDAIYGYQALNVEAQQRNAGSLLQWNRRMIEIRKRHPVFGLGRYEELTSSNPSVLAFVRLPASSDDVDTDGSDRILCVNNLSRFPQPVELDLRRFMGVTPVECMGGVTFPRIGELSYLLTLPGHGFYWFQLPAAREDRSSHAENRAAASDNRALASDNRAAASENRAAASENGPSSAVGDRLPDHRESRQR